MKELIKAAVVGHPVAQSKSPLIHNYWIRKYGFAGSYEAIDIDPKHLRRGLLTLSTRGYAGMNVTLPHKERALDICDHVDGLAKAVGAVNTIKIVDRQLHGTNTDVFGFLENILQSEPHFNFFAGPAVVLGAGGAARAVVHGLLQQGTPLIKLCNRTRDKAHFLAEESGAPARIEVYDWQERADIINNAKLLVNTTSLGMKGQENLDLDLEALPKDALVHDIVYAPLYTDLLKNARVRGNTAITGIGMLLHQARPAFEAWFGVMPDVDAELEKIVVQA